MRPQDFRFRLRAAAYSSTHFAAIMVKDKLHYDFRYLVELNASYDGHRKDDEVIYPRDDGVVHESLEEDEVVSLLCRIGRVPQWIDIHVAFATQKYTHLYLLCCGRYHPDDDRLYYYESGTQPFGIKSPQIPLRHKKGKKLRLPSERQFMDQFYRVRPLVKRLA